MKERNASMSHDLLGKWGEAYALNYLLELGYALQARNYKFNRMEIDLVLIDHQTMVVVEVKTRHSDELGEPWRSVNLAKQKQIIRVANYYTKTIQWPNEVRFDVVSIVHNSNHTDLTHIKDAFSPGP
ncbi:MAG: YraN family protein, partial [Flavobacteriales bacterium]